MCYETGNACGGERFDHVALGHDLALQPHVPADTTSFDVHLLLVDPTDLNAGIVHVGWTRFPRDV